VRRSYSARQASATLWNNLGVMRTRRGAYADAITAFQKALSINANLAPAKASLDRAEQLLAIERGGA